MSANQERRLERIESRLEKIEERLSNLEKIASILNRIRQLDQISIKRLKEELD